MKHIVVILSALIAPLTTFAAKNCKPLDETPITMSVQGKSGVLSLTSNGLTVEGNALSPKQPAEKLVFVAGSLRFSLTPLSSCQDGLLLEFQNNQVKKQALASWDQAVIVNGKAGSDSFVSVTVHRYHK